MTNHDPVPSSTDEGGSPHVDKEPVADGLAGGQQADEPHVDSGTAADDELDVDSGTAAADEARVGSGTDAADATNERLAVAERERDEYLDHLRRERAEFENFRRRAMRDRMDALDRGAQALVTNLLGVLDNFGFVLKAADGSSDEQLAKGAHMVHTELLKVLQQAGLEEVPGVGEPFDPNWHEAMMQVEGDVEQPTVVDVLRPGYRFKGRVLRPASVSVAQ